MNKYILIFGFLILTVNGALANQNCFVVIENNIILNSEGDCQTFYSPCSTFKIAISIMGYDSGLLVDETHPTIPYKSAYLSSLESWKQPQNPTTWMKNSCVWYSQILTQKLGINKFDAYLQKLNYGNKNTKGDPLKNNGLTDCWLSSSLKISPVEQVELLNNLINNNLPVTLKAQQMTKNILFIKELSNNWILYGKTGSCWLFKRNGKKSDFQHGWFIGWLNKNDRNIIFVNHIVDEKKEDGYAGPRAKIDAEEKLLKIIEQIEN